MLLTLLIIFGFLLFALAIGTPVAFALGITTVFSTLVFMDLGQLSNITSIAFKQSTSMNQLVAPLFILMAEFLARGDIASDIFRVLNKYLKKLKGGLAISAILASTIFAALCGSSPATAASIGRISIKEMKALGYRGDFAVGTVVGGGTLGIMIPPSITFVTYGIITENSIARLLIAGMLPGLLISFLFCVFIIIRVRLNPSLINSFEGQKTAETTLENLDQSNFMQDFKRILPSVLLIGIVLGSLYSGLATPTEVAGFGAVGAMMLVVLMKRFNIDLLKDVLRGTARTGTMILFMLICGLTLSYVISYLGLPQNIAKQVVSMGLSKWAVLSALYLIWIILGCLMDPGSMIILTIPFIYPTMMSLGFDPIWLGVVAVLCVEIGMITPPVGLNLFVIKSVTDVPMSQIITGALPYVLVLLVSLLVLTIFPQIALFLPSRM